MNLFKDYPASQANLNTNKTNLNDELSIGSIINLDDLVVMANGKEIDITPEQAAEYAKSGKLPVEDAYFVFKLIISKPDGTILTKNSAPFTIFNLDVKVGDKNIKLNEYSKRLKADGSYNADAVVTEGTKIDFSKVGPITIKGFENEFENRPTVIESRESMPNFFKKNVHFIEDETGNKKHFKFASKDHDGSGQFIRKARATKSLIDYAKIAMMPVFSGAKQLRIALVSI